MANEPSSDAPPVVRAARTVTPPYGSRPNQEMNVVGLIILAGLLVLLFPLAPFILAFWLLSKVYRALR